MKSRNRTVASRYWRDREMKTGFWWTQGSSLEQQTCSGIRNCQQLCKSMNCISQRGNFMVMNSISIKINIFKRLATTEEICECPKIGNNAT